MLNGVFFEKKPPLATLKTPGELECCPVTAIPVVLFSMAKYHHGGHEMVIPVIKRIA